MKSDKSTIMGRLREAIFEVQYKHGVGADTLVMNLDTIIKLGHEAGFTVPVVTVATDPSRKLKTRCRYIDISRSKNSLTFMGLTLVGNDFLNEDKALLTRKIGPEGDQVIGVVDLKPKPEFDAERDTVINVADKSSDFMRYVIPREAIAGVKLDRDEIRTGYSGISRGKHGPYKFTLTLREEPYAVTSLGQPCILNVYQFYDDPAGKPQTAKPEYDDSYVKLAEK